MTDQFERLRVEAARRAMWACSDPLECTDCGKENPRRAPCCGVCGGELEEENNA